jgi:hypothetical protein
MTTFKQMENLYQNSYGSAVKISRTKLIGAFIILCIVTPFTNWMIPIAPKLIKKGITVRYG